jgi:hypothetical protein
LCGPLLLGAAVYRGVWFKGVITGLLRGPGLTRSQRSDDELKGVVFLARREAERNRQGAVVLHALEFLEVSTLPLVPPTTRAN